MRVLVSATALAVGWCSIPGGVASAQCEEASPAVGISARRCEEPGRRWMELVVELPAADTGVRVTRPSEGGVDVVTWAENIPGAVAAVQAGELTFPELAPAGLTVGDGQPWSEGMDDARRSVLLFDERDAALLVPPDQVVPAEDWMRNVVSGVPIVRDGMPIGTCEGEGCRPGPRTALGLSADGRRLVVVVVEGWTARSDGVDDVALGQMARVAGAVDAIRTGRGATSVMWTRGGMAIPSSDGSPRPTPAFLAVIDRESGVETRLRGVVEKAGDPDTALPDAHILIETLEGVPVTEGGTMTEGAYFERVLPAREYFVKASLDGYRSACKYCPATTGGEVWCSLFLSEGEGEERCAAPEFEIEAGPWPTGDVPARDGGMVTMVADAGKGTRDAAAGGGDPGGGDGRCVVAHGPGRPGPWAAVMLLCAVLGAARHSERGRSGRTRSGRT